ncbi:hypothetical protein Q5688_27605 [Microcoleus sp. herbarium5]
MRKTSAKTLTLICEAIARTTLLEAFLHDEDRAGGGRVGIKDKACCFQPRLHTQNPLGVG